MRDGDWKVLAKLDIDKAINVTTENEAKIKAAEISDVQIFRVTDDIGENNDLAASMPEKLVELTELLKANYQQLVDGSHVWPGKTK